MTPAASPDELAPLIEVMTASQRLRFKQEVVRQAIGYVTRLLPPEAEDEGHRSGIRAAEAWLADPTDAKAEAAAMFAAAECWDGGVRYHDYPAGFLAPAWTAGETDPRKAAQHALNAAPEGERASALAWQITTARTLAASEF